MLREDSEKAVTIGNNTFENFGRPVILAEIGTLFNQDVGDAVKLIEHIAHVQSGHPDIPIMFKGEFLLSAEICLDDDSVETFQSRSGERVTERYRDLISRKVLPAETYKSLVKEALNRKLDCVMSVYDVEGVALAKDTGIRSIKISSSNVNHIPLIRKVAESCLPMIIDTGRATMAEVERAVETSRCCGAQIIMLEHSPDGHPAPDRNHDLQSLRTLQNTFGLPVGFSCHASDNDACLAAVALGAAFIEKNLSLEPDSLEQDTAFSVGIDDFETFVGRVDRAYLRMGTAWRDVATQTGLIATSARMGLIAKIDLVAGDICDLNSVGFAFPAKGVSVADFDRVLGWRLITDRLKGSPIDWADLKPQ